MHRASRKPQNCTQRKHRSRAQAVAGGACLIQRRRVWLMEANVCASSGAQPHATPGPDGVVARLVGRWRRKSEPKRATPASGPQATHASVSGVPGTNQGPTHLIVLANGLFGSPANWTTIVKQLSLKLDTSQVCQEWLGCANSHMPAHALCVCTFSPSTQLLFMSRCVCTSQVLLHASHANKRTDTYGT
jgi:hypothetical protein